MKKALLFTAASLAVVMMFTGCGKKGGDNSSTEPKTEMEQQLASYGKNAAENVDIDKVEGETLDAESGGNSKGKIGDYEIKIEEAKVVDYENAKYFLVQFEFKNNGSEDINFAGAVKVETSQENKLPPSFVNDIEGVDVSALAQLVSKGEKINVQKIYRLMDDETPVTVSVRAADGQKGSGVVEKTFKIK